VNEATRLKLIELEFKPGENVIVTAMLKQWDNYEATKKQFEEE
jgi:hypothetical protein